jgi:hypothetical protein
MKTQPLHHMPRFALFLREAGHVGVQHGTELGVALTMSHAMDGSDGSGTLT